MAKAETKSRPKGITAGAASGPRLRKGTRRQTRAKAKSDARSRSKIPGSFKLTGGALKTIKHHWKPLGGIVLVYLVLNIIFASGLSGITQEISNIKDSFNENGSSPVASAIGGFSTLVVSAGTSGNTTGSALQGVLIVIESLVVIWALRHLLAGQAIRIKEAYYNSMYPLIPFILVLMVVIIQLLPVTVGSVVLNLILSSVIVDTTLLTIIFSIAFVLLTAWSLYMVSSSVFALYIITLPDMRPRQALRTAKDLVKFRRLAVMRRALFLPVFIFVALGAIIIPLIMFVTPAVAPVFFVLSMLTILFVHTYLYSLYRSLL